MKRLVIVGGGISGLCAAHEATRRAAAVEGGLDVIVLESSREVGGKARTRRLDGWLVEEGPAAYLDSEPEFARLLQRAGVAPHTIGADPAAARRYIYRDGLREAKPSPLGIARSGILDLRGLVRLVAEPFIPRADEAVRSAESIWDFAARRLGRQAADRLVAPAVLGVFAGDARKLSLTACFPRLAELEREHGGLLRGALARRGKRSRPQRIVDTGARSGGGDAKGEGAGPGGGLASTPEGMQTIPRLLATDAPFATRCDARVEKIARVEKVAGVEEAARVVAGARVSGTRGTARSSGGAPRFDVWVAGDGEPIPANAIVLAGEAHANAALLESLNPAAGAALREIETPPLAVVALGYPPQVARRFPVGYGVLIPRGCGYRVLGCIWESQVFPGRSPANHLLVRSMIGGAVDPSATDLGEAELLALARDELARLLGLRRDPVFGHAARWRHAIPQYDIGHPRRVDRIAAAMHDTPGVFLAGNALHGVAFAKAAVTGMQAGRAAADWLARS